MNRSRHDASRPSSASSISNGVARPLSSSKTVSKRAQRRIQQLVDLEEAAAGKDVYTKKPQVWPAVAILDYAGRRIPPKRPPRKIKDATQYSNGMAVERERRKQQQTSSDESDSDSDHSNNGSDDEKKSKKQLLTETLTIEHERIESLISGYSNRVAQLNDLSRNAPSMDGIHEWNARAVRKQAGAIRYHNKATGAVHKTRRQHDNRFESNGKHRYGSSHHSYTSRAETLAYAVTKVVQIAAGQPGTAIARFHSFHGRPLKSLMDDVETATHLREQLERPQIMMHDAVQDMLSDGTRKGKSIMMRHARKAAPHRKHRVHVRSSMQHGSIHGEESMGGSAAGWKGRGRVTIRKEHKPQLDLS